MSDFSNYYDGRKNQTLEPIQAKKNQKVIITVLDEFVEEMPVKKGQKEPDSGGIQSWVTNDLENTIERLSCISC